MRTTDLQMWRRCEPCGRSGRYADHGRLEGRDLGFDVVLLLLQLLLVVLLTLVVVR